jgi:hypothetical protein
MGVGMPFDLYLHEFGSQVWVAFGDPPYHVGSSVFEKIWRDVDVRVLLPDEIWDKLELGDPKYAHDNERWVSLCLAYSALGKQMTGLPIDFQIQKISWANKEFPGQPRSALGMTPLRVMRIDAKNEGKEER